MRTSLILIGILFGQIVFAQPGQFRPDLYRCRMATSFAEENIVLEKQGERLYKLSYSELRQVGWFDDRISTEKGRGEKVNCDFDASIPYIATCYNTETNAIVLDTLAQYGEKGIGQLTFTVHVGGGQPYGHSFFINQCEIK